ncbi:MAG: HAMP domain-containing sensor histidine kinase [Bacteroidia bacterium]
MKKIINSLFWRISAVFMVLLIVIGAIYTWITVDTAEQYFLNTHQRLNASIAEHTVKEVPPFLNGEVSKDAMDKIMHSMMAINPAIEVYILDPKGNILTYVAPYKKVKLTAVSLEPIAEFIHTRGEVMITGDDPRNPGTQKVFSAAPVVENNQVMGYVYIVLASEEYVSVGKYLFGDFMLNLSGRNILFTLVASLLVGLFAIWLLTRNLRNIMETVRRFAAGELFARIPVKAEGELAQLSRTFNEMADTIEGEQKRREAIENLRKELIANVSHDLRTPLAVVRGYIETLSIKGPTLLPAERERYIDVSLDSIDKLEKLVNDLFELSKLEAEQVQLRKEPVSISELVQDVVFKYQILAQKKGIDLQLNLPPDHAIVLADIALLERVLQNLIDNALKFTPSEGKIEVEIARENGQVRVFVNDTGPGISEVEIPYIFDRYHKAHNPANKNGSGLGLAIVKKILELHNTTISISSAINQGCQFSFQLPLYLKER